MAKRRWNIEVNGTKHLVELEHAQFWGTRRIWVDGTELELPRNERGSFIDWGTQHRFEVGGKPHTLRIGSGLLGFSYTLQADDSASADPVTKTPNKKFSLQSYFQKIDTEEKAVAAIQETAQGVVILSAATALFMTLLGDLSGWIDVVLYAILAWWLNKKHSLIAAVIMIVLSGITIGITINNILSINPTGGKNILLSAIVFYSCIRAFLGAKWLRDHTAKPASADKN